MKRYNFILMVAIQVVLGTGGVDACAANVIVNESVNTSDITIQVFPALDEIRIDNPVPLQPVSVGDQVTINYSFIDGSILLQTGGNASIGEVFGILFGFTVPGPSTADDISVSLSGFSGSPGTSSDILEPGGTGSGGDGIGAITLLPIPISAEFTGLSINFTVESLPSSNERFDMVGVQVYAKTISVVPEPTSLILVGTSVVFGSGCWIQKRR